MGGDGLCSSSFEDSFSSDSPDVYDPADLEDSSDENMASSSVKIRHVKKKWDTESNSSARPSVGR